MDIRFTDYKFELVKPEDSVAGVLKQIFHQLKMFYEKTSNVTLTLVHVGIISNLLVLILILKSFNLRSKPPNFFIIAISITDTLLAASFALRFVLIFFNLKCLFGFTIMILFDLQVGFTADRYFVICHPLTYYNYKHSGYQNWIIIACLSKALLCFFLLAVGIIGDVELFRILLVWIFLGIVIISFLFGRMQAEISKMVTMTFDDEFVILILIFDRTDDTRN